MSRLSVEVSPSAGFCWGVQTALELARKAVAEAPGPINTLGPLIHNPGVIAELRDQGIGVIESAKEAVSGTVILRSHGVPREARKLLERSSVNLIDATCRFVKSAQDKAAGLKTAGYLVLILGEREHPEVLALRSYAGDDSVVVEGPDDLPERLPSARVGVVVQTTQSQERLSALVARLASMTRELLVHNTICRATEQRQAAALSVARNVDVVVVVGGRNSANTRRLTELCSNVQPRTYHVERPEELRAEWFTGVSSVGITAGASTPPDQIEAVASLIRELDP